MRNGMRMYHHHRLRIVQHHQNLIHQPRNPNHHIILEEKIVADTITEVAIVVVVAEEDMTSVIEEKVNTVGHGDKDLVDGVDNHSCGEAEEVEKDHSAEDDEVNVMVDVVEDRGKIYLEDEVALI